MNNFFKSIAFITLSIFVVSCSNSSSSSEPLRDYSAQYTTDLANIEQYLKTHYMEVINDPGQTDDQNVTFTLIPDGGTQTSIWDQTQYPLQTRNVTVTQNSVDITYKIYYLQLRQGSGPNSKAPCNVDRVLTSYRGEYMYSSTTTVNNVDVTKILSTQFEESINPQGYFNLTGVIRGWSEIFPKFKTGSYVGNPDGSISFSDFGAGVMFIPSGLGYYSTATGGIPAYSPLIFSFKLYEIQRMDQDADGIPSYQEDVNNDGYMYTLATGVVNPDDTDSDEIPNYLDTDDDGDHFTTLSETKYVNPLDPLLTVRYYPFDGAAVDDPTTPYIDETKGIPSCSNDYTSPTRLRKHLDPSCH